MRKIIIIIVLLISSFSFYGVVNEDGEKVGSVKEILQMENITQEENSIIAENNELISIQEMEEKAESSEEKEQDIVEPKEQENIKKQTETSNKQTEIAKTNTNTNQVINNTSNELKSNKTEESQNKIEEQVKKETQEIKKEESENPALANTTYRKVNTEVLSEIKIILEEEISENKDLVGYGTKVINGNKTDAYRETNGFTYMFVNDITKGKINGNYKKFPERVQNTVGAVGKYYIYAEDEYVYDSKGRNPMWSQTLIWIYITF